MAFGGRLGLILARIHIVAAFITSSWMPFPGVQCANFKRTYFGRDENQVIKAADTDANAENFYYSAIGAIPSSSRDRPGEPSDSSSCQVVRPLTQVTRRIFAVDFYDKFTEAYGIPVLASFEVSDVALSRACYVLRFLLADRNDIRRAYYKSHGRVVVIGRGQTLLDVPEYNQPGLDLIGLPSDGPSPLGVRGLAAVAVVPVTTAPEENLLCYDSATSSRDSFDDVLLKTLAIGILNLAAARGIGRAPFITDNGDQIPDDDVGDGDYDDDIYHQRFRVKEELESIYNHAMRSGWWRHTNAARGAESYFGEGVQSYFNANSYAFPPDGYHNDINTRTKLRNYDTWLYTFIQNFFPCANNYIKRCNSRGNEPYQTLATSCLETGLYYGRRRRGVRRPD